MGTKIGGKYLDPLTSASVSIAEKSVVFCASRVTKREVDGTFVLNRYPLIQAFKYLEKYDFTKKRHLNVNLINMMYKVDYQVRYMGSQIYVL